MSVKQTASYCIVNITVIIIFVTSDYSLKTDIIILGD